MNMTNPLGLSPRVLALAEQAEEERAPQFAQIDAVAEYNSQKVLAAFQKHRVAEPFFAGTTGYGYDDQGRDAWTLFTRIFSARRMPWSASNLSTEPMPLPLPVRRTAAGRRAGLRRGSAL